MINAMGTKSTAATVRLSELVGTTKQDATRRRRTRDEARRRWYARWRSIRWARHYFHPISLPV